MNIEDKKIYLQHLRAEIEKADKAAIATGEITPLLALKKEYARISQQINQTNTNHEENRAD